MSQMGSILRNLRKELKLSQAALAQKSGLSQSAIADYELGTRDPSVTAATNLAEALNVSIDYLLGKTTERNVNKKNDSQIDIISIKNSIITKKLVYGGKELPPFEEELFRRIILSWIELKEAEMKNQSKDQ